MDRYPLANAKDEAFSNRLLRALCLKRPSLPPAQPGEYLYSLPQGPLPKQSFDDFTKSREKLEGKSDSPVYILPIGKQDLGMLGPFLSAWLHSEVKLLTKTTFASLKVKTEKREDAPSV